MRDAVIADICRRVLGAECAVAVTSGAQGVQVRVSGAPVRDPLTRSQQEMDVILSLQHLLGAVAVRLEVS